MEGNERGKIDEGKDRGRERKEQRDKMGGGVEGKWMERKE